MSIIYLTSLIYISISEGGLLKLSSITRVVDWIQEMNAKLGIPEKLRDILTLNKEPRGDHINDKYDQTDNSDGILTEEQVIDLSLKAEKNNTGFTNFIRYTNNDYSRVLKECL